MAINATEIKILKVCDKTFKELAAWSTFHADARKTDILLKVTTKYLLNFLYNSIYYFAISVSNPRMCVLPLSVSLNSREFMSNAINPVSSAYVCKVAYKSGPCTDAIPNPP